VSEATKKRDEEHTVNQKRDKNQENKSDENRKEAQHSHKRNSDSLCNVVVAKTLRGWTEYRSLQSEQTTVHHAGGRKAQQ